MRAFLARILGWGRGRISVVDEAYRSVLLAVDRRAALVLCGRGDLVPVASALHRRTFGPSAPFVLCDPRRGNAAETVRSPANRATGIEAIAAASGGTICLRARRLPRDFAAVVDRVRDPHAHVQTIVCWGQRGEHHPLLVIPAPIVVPDLRDRAGELSRIIDEYALDAIEALAAPSDCFTDVDRSSVAAHASSLEQIEKATLRLVALRMSRNLSGAAARLDMAPVSLTRWLARRPRVAPDGAAHHLPLLRGSHDGSGRHGASLRASAPRGQSAQLDGTMSALTRGGDR
jgi:hypothetical protein